MKAEIIAVGTELLLGQIANTNAQFLSQVLAQLGIGVYYHTVVGDNGNRLADTLNLALQRSDLILFTGGLGPTKDDLTKETIGKITGKTLVEDAQAMRRIEKYFNSRNIPMTENNRRQAQVIDGAHILPNDHGMAPGMAFTYGNQYLMLLPGPPREMKPMFQKYGVPYIFSLMAKQKVVHSKVLRFFGIGESALEEKLMDLIDGQSNPTLAPLASEGEVTIRITALADSVTEADGLIDDVEKEIQSRVGEFIYGYNGDSLATVLMNTLKEQGKTLSLAESITGGLISHFITSIPGSSQVYRGGIVCYSDEVKNKLLGVPEDVLQKEGAVSAKTAEILAKEVRKGLGTDIGLSITGEAGPNPSGHQPVGKVFIGLDDDAGTLVEEIQLSGHREGIQLKATKHGLFMLIERLKKG
ncbi:MAG TPA: competence/damage-inducible protein A [Paenibacillaceae bacterium]|nr:competence/damage-inducible protein A [Paenibacillaceae bacterium]